MCLDISHDGNILISGSADKTIKIWGLDFGDCHRLISITSFFLNTITELIINY